MTRLSLSKVCQAWGTRVRELQGIGRVSQGLSVIVRVGGSGEDGRFWRAGRGLPCLLPQPVSLLRLVFSLSAGDVVQSLHRSPTILYQSFSTAA